MAASETRTRVAVAAVGVPIALAAVFLGGWVLAILLAVLAALAAQEFFRLCETKRVRPIVPLGAGAAAMFVLLGAASGGFMWPGAVLWGATVALVLVALTASIWTHGVEANPLLASGITAFGALYTGGMLVHGILLRHLPGVESAWHGTALVFAPVLLTWASDTSAYFVGRAWGRRKLIPRVSPGKTVEGSIGALVGTVAVAVLYSFLLARFGAYRMGIGEAVFFGLLISVTAQIGDLAESLLKRDAGVKDSGTLFPGHGGVLDRMDSLLFTLPVAYLFFRFVAGAA
jgi:phosphatidate cytidylyltransferase